jgi:hypothetical protein
VRTAERDAEQDCYRLHGAQQTQNANLPALSDSPASQGTQK